MFETVIAGAVELISGHVDMDMLLMIYQDAMYAGGCTSQQLARTYLEWRRACDMEAA